jgi:transcriptional regulator with GAF, ATPase, and Fis domain
MVRSSPAGPPSPEALSGWGWGTLFLDEIGEMPAAMQAKRLRVLETGEVQPIGSTRRGGAVSAR